MEAGDLIFIRGTEGLAWPITKVTRSPYTHVAGVVEEGQLIESQALRRTGFQPLATYQGVGDIYTCPELKDWQREGIVEYVQRWIGCRYDYFLFTLLAFRQILGGLVPVYLSDKRHICTTLWVEAYRAVGIDLCPGIRCPTPGELAGSPHLRYLRSF
ncbi:MAG: hypothetical protein K6T63_11905 [Alicyclobacillus herbarius]|uniref:hypothetical protein n=1 Tax=Alicyclobacillus herbarius TaxID=122960 RepID=UPI0003FE628D|nr:hypothetical protein [Alicyclobacillus herbarius]MCL6633321.1 hypothetical protein [Alicyclobacillus herbarius]